VPVAALPQALARSAQPEPLATIDAAERSGAGGRTARAHFHYGDQRSAPGDDVDFELTDAQVARDDRVALPSEPLGYELLGAGA
jgi:hypothetical protein